MTLYVVDAYADLSKPAFSVYLVRSSSKSTAQAAVEAHVGAVERIEVADAKDQSLFPELSQDAPSHLADFEATWLHQG